MHGEQKEQRMKANKITGMLEFVDGYDVLKNLIRQRKVIVFKSDEHLCEYRCTG